MHDPKHAPEALEHALSRLYSTEAPASFETAWRAAVRREEMLQMKSKPKKRGIWRVAAPVFAAFVLVAGSLWAGTQNLQIATQEGPPSANRSLMTADSASRAKSGMELSGGAQSLTANEGAGYAMYDTQGESADYEAPGARAGAGETGAAAEESGRKLVRTASLIIRSTAFESDVEKVTALLKELGGYVENLYQFGDTQSGSARTVSLSMRVPSDSLDRFLAGMEGIGRVTDRSESTADMTVQYADNEARLNTLREKMTRLNELLKQAENVSDLVEIENAIADTQYQIDSYETSQRSIDRQVDMSAVSVSVVEETPAESAAAGDMSLGTRVSAAFQASVRWLGEFFRNMLVFIVMALPVLAPAAVIGLIVWLAVRRRRARRMEQEPDSSSNDPGEE